MRKGCRTYAGLPLAVAAVVLLGVSCARHAPVPAPAAKADADAAETNPEVAGLNQDIALAAGRAKATTSDYKIGADDLLEVTLFDIEGKNGEPRSVSARVSQSGTITLPLVGSVEIGNKTPVDAEATLKERYRRFIHDPQVTVFVKEYRSYRVSVVGYVEKPGVYEVSGQRSLLEVLAMAGGLNAKAGKTLQISRGGEDKIESIVVDLDRLSREGDMSLNLAMMPGDVVNVPKAGVVYVTGSVKKPGAYRLRETMTVSQAVGAAGGPDDKLAQHDAVRLFRRGPQGDRIEVPVDLEHDDVQLVENDIVVVPMSMPRYVVDRFIGGVGMGLSVPLF